MARKTRKTKYADDSMVPIFPPALRAAMEHQCMSASELARLTRNSQQTISHLTKGDEPKRCRHSRLEALARALGVAAEQLQGEGIVLPRGHRAGFEFDYSARTRFAAGRLMTRAWKALRRDAQRSRATAGPHGETDPFLLNEFLRDYLAELMKIGSWRERFLVWREPRHARQGYSEPLARDYKSIIPRPRDDPAHEEGVVTLIRALEHILEPWLTGHASLDYASLRELATTTMPEKRGERLHPASVVPEGGLPDAESPAVQRFRVTETP